MKKRILITGVLVALIMFVFILMGKKIVKVYGLKLNGILTFHLLNLIIRLTACGNHIIFICAQKMTKRF